MFFKKKLTDCKDLVDAGQIDKPFHNKFFAAAIYSYPSHKDKEVMDRIYSQKKLIEEYGVAEAVNALAQITTYTDQYINFSDKFIQDIPHWSDPTNVSQTSTRFVLNGYRYIAEQHGSNFCSMACLYRNDEPIFACTSITTQNTSGEFKTALNIISSKVNEDEIKVLVAFANTAQARAKLKREESWNKLMKEDAKKSDEVIKNRF